MKNIRILKEAELELWEAAVFYEEKRKGLGLDFEFEIRRSLLIIQTNPTLWPKRFFKFRKFIIQKFPFDIWYYIENRFIRIYAIAHQRRQPNYWKSRNIN